MRKKGWEEPTNGPDWIDVEMMLRSLSALHSGRAGLTVLPRGTGSNGGLSVACSMMFDVLPGSSLPAIVSTESTWPCADHKTLAAHAFAGLHQLDYEISKVYKNEELWK
jgi:hypothetical protein